jgi:hypothetical protein
MEAPMTHETPDLQAILERLEKLEKQNRRLRQAAVLALAAVGVLVLMGQAAPKSRTIEAEKFVLRGPHGKIEAELLSDDTGPRLILFQEDGIEPAAVFYRTGLLIYDHGILDLSLGPGGPRLAFHDEHAQARTEWLVTDQGMLLHVWDAGGFKFTLGTSGASLVMLDKDRKVIWRAP